MYVIYNCSTITHSCSSWLHPPLSPDILRCISSLAWKHRQKNSSPWSMLTNSSTSWLPSASLAFSRLTDNDICRSPCTMSLLTSVMTCTSSPVNEGCHFCNLVSIPLLFIFWHILAWFEVCVNLVISCLQFIWLLKLLNSWLLKVYNSFILLYLLSLFNNWFTVSY